MDAARALADLTEISSQIEAAVVVGPRGGVQASNLDDAERAKRFAEAARRLLDEAVEDGRAPTQLEAATPSGSVFVVREGSRLIAATTRPEPTVGLVFYDLRSCLRAIDSKRRAKDAEA